MSAGPCYSNNWTAPRSSRCPPKRYVIAHWKPVRPNIDYHVEIERHYYSVPFQLVGQPLEARYTAPTVEIFHRGARVASHVRSYAAYAATTIHQHRPKSHQAHLEWTPSRLINWAATVGPATAEVVRTILESKPHPEAGYRACLGILSLAKTYYGGAFGSGQPAGLAAAGLFLPESEIHPEAIARSATHARARSRPLRAAP